MKNGVLLAAMAILCGTTTALAFDAGDFWKEPGAEVPLDVKVVSEGSDSNLVWQGIVYTSEMYKGQPMRIFAWYVHRIGSGRLPAVLSIHGGGGGADLQRAQAFARSGYACLSYDWNAWRQTNPTWKTGDPLPSGTNTVYCGLYYDDWGKHFMWPGPDGDWKWPELYRSIIAARRALTWLSQQPDVDPAKLMAEGHSWGGFAVQLLAGIEPRLKAVVSSAAAGGWADRQKAGLEGHTRGMTAEQAAECFARFDPASFADRIAAPVLVRLAAAGFFGSADDLAAYWSRIKAPKSLELLPAGNHTFDDVETRVAWFDRWMRSGPSFPEVRTVTAAPQRGGAWKVTVTAGGASSIQRALVAWTVSTNEAWNRRLWVSRPLAKDASGKWTGLMAPAGTGGPLRWFVSVRDTSGRVASSLPEVAKPTAEAEPASPPVQCTNFIVRAAQRSPMGSDREWRRAARVGPVAAAQETVGEQAFNLDTLWDDRMLYIRVQVHDATPWVPVEAGGDWANGDVVRLRLAEPLVADGVPRPGRKGGLRLACHPDESGVTCLESEFEDEEGRKLSGLSGVTPSVAFDDDTTYTVAVSIPWRLLAQGLRPAQGYAFECAASVSFGDHLTRERVGLVELNRFDPRDKSAPGGLAQLE